MIIELNEIEARVLGTLVEKSLTTPESYPLSLNSLVLVCNQKTSREPGSRVPKFMHHAEILLDGADAKTSATICVLLLRGPQTSGEIKTRTDRLCEFASSAEVESLLQDMSLRAEPWVVKLPRQAGQKESRWRQLFTGAVAAAPVAELEKRVAALEEALKRLTPGG